MTNQPPLYQNLVDWAPAVAGILFRVRHGIFRTTKRRISGKSHHICIARDAVLRNVVFNLRGEGHRIEIGPRCIIRNVTFHMVGNSHTISLGSGVRFKRGGSLWMEDARGLIKIENDSTFEDSHLAVTGNDTFIRIGQDCMFANDIEVRTGDSHALLDLDGHKINPEKSVDIGDHVWIGAHCSILKGVSLDGHTVVATRSTVTRSFSVTNVLVGGSPAKILKEGITWSRKRFPGS